jgi:putative ABC transport system permease protein
VWGRLQAGALKTAVTVGRGNLLRMALRNGARNPGRSTLCIALMASAVFLIAAVSAFHLDATGTAQSSAGGTFGYAGVAQSDQPIYQNLNTSEGRSQLGFSPQDEQQLAGCEIVSLRVNAGDDASCLNLYQPRQPRILGLPDALLRRTARVLSDQEEPVWAAFGRSARPKHSVTAAVPVILEKNTANYSLHLWKGVGEKFDVADRHGHTISLEVVALLSNSIFQGDLLITEQDFLRHFPEVSGYRFFLIQAPPEKTAAVRTALERTLGDYGFTTELASERLAGFLAVQNTYLSTFQSLGGLGLLLGTFGLAAVQLRNVLERRGELALLRAAGLRRSWLAAMVMLENGLLLLAGLGVGVLAALVAVLPHLLSRTASIPWSSLAVTLALVLSVGLFAGLLAVRAVLRAPLLAALRLGK